MAVSTILRSAAAEIRDNEAEAVYSSMSSSPTSSQPDSGMGTLLSGPTAAMAWAMAAS